MLNKRRVEIFISDCYLCNEVVELVEDTACEFCDVRVYNINHEGQDKAEAYGISAVPTIVVDGKIADCCRKGNVSKSELMATGIGKPIS